MESIVKTFLVTALLFISLTGCAQSDAQKNTPVTTGDSGQRPQATPSNKFAADDIAKLKWIEGSWRGMDGNNPFYERYKIEGTTMIVEGLKEDGTPDGEPGRFELKNGEFGKGDGDKRSAASEITNTYVQFVPAVPGKRNSFRFELQSDGTWIALLEWPEAPDKLNRQKLYKMEPWPPKK